jgi:hypothetical protein
MATVTVHATCSVHKALHQHALLHEKKSIASNGKQSVSNANGETVVDIGEHGTAHGLQREPSLLKRLAGKAGFVSDSAHGEVSTASTDPLGNASNTMPTDSGTNDADLPAEELMLTNPQSHEPESACDLPDEVSGSTEAVPALNNAQHQIANSHTVPSVHKNKESNRSHVPGRLDRDIAYMVWSGPHKRASQHTHALPRRSNQQDDLQPANDQQDASQPATDQQDDSHPADDQLDEPQPLGDTDSSSVQLPGVKGSLPGAEGNLQRAECSLSGAARNALGAQGDAHGVEGTTYMNDELLAEQKAAAEVPSNSKHGAQHEKRLPDEVLVEQAKQWAGRYGSVPLGLLLSSLEAMCM